MELEKSNALLTIASLYQHSTEQFERKLINYLYEYGIACVDDKDVKVIDLVESYGTTEQVIMNRLFGCYKSYTKRYFNELKLI